MRVWDGPVAEKRVQRRLAAILAADVAGYSRLMGKDEAGTRADYLRAKVRKAVQQGEREDVGRRAIFQRVWELAHAACRRTAPARSDSRPVPAIQRPGPQGRIYSSVWILIDPWKNGASSRVSGLARPRVRADA